MKIKQKTIVVTGATGGIGAAIVNQLLAEGHKIIGWGRQQSPIEDSNYQPIVCDFENPISAEASTKSLLKNLERLDGIVLAAGFGQFNELEQFSIKQMQNVMNVNFLSQAVIVKILLPLIKKTEQSKIIAIASESALAGARKGSMYCAAKFALRGFMQSLRAECVQSDTAVTIINPGLVKTDFFKNLEFKPGDAATNTIVPKQIAKTLAMILDMENNCIFEEINLQPLKKVIQKQ